MGEMDFDYSETDGTWSHEFAARTCKKCRWWYRLKAGDLLGGATDDSGAALREVLVKRYAP
jgi:hypothetical protein